MEAIDIRGEALPSPVRHRTIGRYLLCDEIASGGMATVHLGRLVGAGGFSRVVAIKRLHPPFAREPEFVAMFLDEARLAARIVHPNVISVLDVVADGPDLFLVMEYVRGVPLSLLGKRARARAMPIPASIAARIVCSVLCGLHAAHEATDETGACLDIVHRDVSPQNVLVGTDGVARVFDFGVAKAGGRLQTTRVGQLKGKLSYMAPEQIDDENVSRLTDVYAASVVFWETLTGRRLFVANDERSILGRVLSSPVPAPSAVVPGLPAALDRVVLRGLDRDPAKRYATAHDMVQAIAQSCPVALAREVGEWVVSLAKDDLARSARLAAAIDRMPATEDALHFAERLALAARDSGSGLRAAETCTSRATVPDSIPSHPRAPRAPEEASSVPSEREPEPGRWAPPLVARRSHVAVAIALSALIGAAPLAIGRWLARPGASAAAPIPSCAAPTPRSVVAPDPPAEHTPRIDCEKPTPSGASRSAKLH